MLYVCSDPKFGTGHNFLFSGKWYFGQKYMILTYHLESPLSKNHKIDVTKLKLWPFKGALIVHR